MSRRYEFVSVGAEISLVHPDNEDTWAEMDDESGSEGMYGLVVGDPYASAMVVHGTLEGLEAFAERLSEMLGAEKARVTCECR